MFWALNYYHHSHSFLCLMPSSLRPKAWAVSKRVGGHSSHLIQPLRGLCSPGRPGEINPWELKYCMSGFGHGNLPSRESTEISRPRYLTEHHTDSISQLRICHMCCSTTAPKLIYIFTVCLFSFHFSIPHPGLPCEFLDINTGIGSNSSSVTFSEPSGASKPDIRLVSSAA